MLAQVDTTVARTLGEVLLRSERVHHRSFALRRFEAGALDDFPDWRLHRQILRAALYLRERCHVAAGDKVAVVASLGPRAFILESGAILIGAATAVILPNDPEARTRVESLEARLVVDDPEFFRRALDLGGTLDTAERAQSIRAAGRALASSSPALLYLEGTNGDRGWRSLTHREAVERVLRTWTSTRSTDDVTLAAEPEPTLAARLALFAFVGDGRVRVTFGESSPASDRASRKGASDEQLD